MPKIWIRGDSIAWWHCDYIHAGRVEILRKYFYAKNEDISIINLGVSWDTTTDLIKRFEIEYQARNPEIIIFAIWINDSLILKDTNKNQVSKKDFLKNLEKLKNTGQKYTNNLIYIGLTNTNEELLQPVPRNTNKYYYNTEIQKYSTILERFCKNNNFDFIPLFWLLEDKELEDGLHPNPDWHQKIAEKIKKHLEEKIKKI